MKNRNIALGVLATVFFAAAFPVYSNVKFSGMDLNNDDYLIYSVEHDIPGSIPYKSLFLTKLGESSLSQDPKLITCFPERMELVAGGTCLQLRNRYGTAVYSIADEKLSWVSTADEIPVDYRNLGTVCVSPNGKMTCSVIQKRNAIGELILKNTESGESVVLDSSSSFSSSGLNARWSPDSKVLLYEKNGAVYFVTADSAFKKTQIPESYRKIGDGTISNVQWTKNKSILYISGDIVYVISENELYTRGLYAALLGNGKIAGRLSTPFNNSRDKFWCSADGKKIAVASEKNTITLYELPKDSVYDYAKVLHLYPLTELKGNIVNVNVMWDASANPWLWLDMASYDSGKKISCVYDFKEKLTLVRQLNNSIDPVLSPDGKMVAFTDSGKLVVASLQGFGDISSFNLEQVVCASWDGNKALYVGGTESVRYWMPGLESKVLFISSAKKSFWNGGLVVSRIGLDDQPYAYDSEKGTWKKVVCSVKTPVYSEKNGSFRVFSGNALNKKFDNAIYVRSLSGDVKTYSISKQTDIPTAPAKKVSLVFDAMENADGLASILCALNEYGIKGTFFINGEFIRRYPVETKQIALSGNECASMFYSSADLVKNNFIIDEDFIKRGLGRNEDEFYNATGKELALFWHAPNYSDTQDMVDWGMNAGYSYVNSFAEFSDSTSFACEDGKKYYSAARLIDAYSDRLYDGMIIPVSVGKPKGSREDYLYEKIDILISSILNSGYEIVGIRDLKK